MVDIIIRVVLVLLVCELFGFPSAMAHDIGISQAELLEQDGNRYALSVQTGTRAGYLFGPPVFPEYCQSVGNPRGVQGTMWRRFEFGCDTKLTAEETLLLPWRRDGVVIHVRWNDRSEAKKLFRRKAGYITVPLAELQAGSGSWLKAAERYVNLGIEHILLGIDHLLFVLALLLIVRGPWMLVKTITAFTAAHSLTLGLAIFGFIHIPSQPVEAAIALSIVFLCVEIVRAQKGHRGLTYGYPWVVAFAFGLLHGLGFAGALSQIGLPQNEIPMALLFFNVGVEIGQLLFVGMVIAMSFVLTWAVGHFALPSLTWTRIIPGYVIGVVASYWFIQRVALMVTPLSLGTG